MEIIIIRNFCQYHIDIVRDLLQFEQPNRTEPNRTSKQASPQDSKLSNERTSK